MKHKCYLFFKTLGTKLKINILFKLKEKPLNVTELSQSLNQERSKVSHALKTLLICKFITVRKIGKKRIYSINNDTINPLLNLVELHIKNYCNFCKEEKL